MKKGTYVLRSTYQKLAAERDRMLKDLDIITRGGMFSAEAILITMKWREKFAQERAFNKMLREIIFEGHKQDVARGQKCRITNCPVCSSMR